jgi:FSR family fosmidomycin resistance protein-like MFS transporter
MSRQVIRLVLLVSCAHALVHVYELSLPSVEQNIGAEYQVGTRTTGLLGNVWRLPWGVGAILAGWLADRYGSRRLLIIYLVGCGATALVAAQADSLRTLFVAMFAMGAFASIYHPAGLAIISSAAGPRDRTMALGYHGIFGSAGIALAPFLAAIVLGLGATWRTYYLILVVPGVVLAVVLYKFLPDTRHGQRSETIAEEDDRPTRWRQYFLLVAAGTLGGFVYAAFLNFLPRYLAGDAASGVTVADIGSSGAYWTAGVLVVGIGGQFLAGHLGRFGRLERTLVIVIAASVPFLAAMALASGPWRIAAAAGFVFVHFMQQPIYNSLLAEYAAPRRRSVAYGFSNMMAFGLGSFGAGFAGVSLERFGTATTYGTLAAITIAGSLIAVTLWWNHGRAK